VCATFYLCTQRVGRLLRGVLLGARCAGT
jgi:hypothetical protein